MVELVDVLRPDGTSAGQSKPKEEVHREGDWHRSVHVWIATPDRRLLLQRRPRLQENFPGMWDVSAAGHVSAGENPWDTAVREAAEELGVEIRPDELRHIATQRER